MSINLAALGVRWDAGTVRWGSKDALLYAVGVGAGAADPSAELQFTTENSRGVDQVVLPTFLVTLRGNRTEGMPALGDFGNDRILHAEQAIELPGLIPVTGSARVGSVVSRILDKGKHALIEIESELRDTETDALVGTGRSMLHVRDAGGFGGDRGESAQWSLPDREPDHTLTATTRPEQALLYRLTGDRNPLHSDPTFAARASFDRPILHGLCTYGFAGRMLTEQVLGGDARRFRGMSVRFASPVWPGDVLTVRAWENGDEEVLFVVSVGDRVVLDRGRLTTVAEGSA
ncbi:3-hydroxyacyl-thioester dehydratase HtdY [Pseudonocardia ailaonensis]|uniref:3-hydroxyacyl-thioester dehydratase HtdY n=1 Tax=Pseudonocardia ailaonensis TaxID=367279 RepID=A0ABN2MHH8_9PSEU